MNIVFLTINGKNDTRTRAFIRILRRMGNLICVSKKTEERTIDVESPNDIEFEYNGISDLGNFIAAAYKAKRKLKQIDLLFLDNRMASIPNFLFGKKCGYVIQDAREFYSIKETPHMVGKIGCVLERQSLRKADMVICANSRRAHLMKERFSLPELPFVYENIFPSDYDECFDIDQTRSKYDHFFSSEKMNLISSAGCQIERTTDKLVHSVKKFQDKVQLLLVGGASREDEETIKGIIQVEHIQNVTLIGHVDTNTLKYLMRKSDIGVVIYGKHDANNRYCASGKIYEYLNEKLPMIASGNEPLIDFFEKTHTGIASDNYEEAIQNMLDHFSEYKANAEKFYQTFDPDAGNKQLEEEIKRRLNEHCYRGE